MKIATWNVNSINARLANVLDWFREADPDIACLQEIKCQEEKFPALEFEDMGYNVAVFGQKTFNGVALISKYPLEDVVRGLPGDASDEQARYIEALIAPEGGRALRVCCLYLPNGNPAPGAKYDYKLKWMKRLKKRAQKHLAEEEAFALLGDFNVIQGPDDVHDPDKWADDALFRLETREAFREIHYLGFTDALMQARPGAHQYTFWDYQAGAWQKDWGIRIDHILLSPQAADRLIDAGIDRKTRGREKPSDHVPVWAELKE